MKYFLNYGIVINFGALASLCFFAYMFCVSNEVAENAERMARCYIIPSEENHVDGHVRLYQKDINSEVRFELEIYASEVSEIVMYSHNNKNMHDYKCDNLGEEVLKLQINDNNNKSKPLTSKVSIISEVGKLPNFSLFDDSIYNYSCVAKMKSHSFTKISASSSKGSISHKNATEELQDPYSSSFIAGCGRLQKYELETSYYFGLIVTLINLVLGMLYFYKFGI